MTIKDLKYLSLCAYGATLFSTCSLRQYMSIVLSEDGRIVGTGYNGSPPGTPHCVDGHCPRALNPTEPGQDYSNCIAVHAEQNALLFSDRTARLGGTLYVNGRSCYDCAKIIAGSGISRLVVVENEYASWPESMKTLASAGVNITEYKKEDIGKIYECDNIDPEPGLTEEA